MKKVFLSFLAFLAISFVANTAFAQVKYLEITIKQVKVWPTKPSGKCWDPCFMKRYKLPPRGKKNYNAYFNNTEFTKACSGSKAPDPLVEIKIGKYEKFTTDKINNKCNPTFNLKKVFRVTPNDPFSVGVYDNDGGAGFQVKRDLMGFMTYPSVPKELINGGTLVIRSFGQVESLVLTSRVVNKPAATGCAGTYKVRLVEFDVKARKANGKTWDRGFGRFKKPDVMIELKIGNDSFQTPKKQDTLAATFSNVGKTMAIKKGMTLNLTVYDKDGFGSKEVIGQTAIPDVCTIINERGSYTFKPFGQVNKIVLIFTRQ